MANTGKNLEKLRDLCLSLPETSQTDSWGHPNFKAGKKTFAVHEWVKGRPLMGFRLDGADRDIFLMDPAFFEPPYSQGKWVAVWADGEPDWTMIADLVMRSYRTVALKRMIKALDG